MLIKEKLLRTDLFHDLAPDQLEALARLAIPRSFKQGSMVFEQEQYAEFLYILLSGEVSIRFKPHDGEDILVTRVTAGGVCGWSAVLGRAIYTSAAECTQSCETLCFRGRELQNLCESYPETGVVILERLAAVIAERLTYTNEKILQMLSQNMIGNPG